MIDHFGFRWYRWVMKDDVVTGNALYSILLQPTVVLLLTCQVPVVLTELGTDSTEPVPNTADGGGGEVPIQPDPNPDLETTNDVNDDLQCPDPTPINGTLKVLSGKPYGYACKVQLTCDPGLDFPDGQHVWTLTCLGLSVLPPKVQWDPYYTGQPTCKDNLQCPDPTPINGTLNVLSGKPYGYACKVQLTCDPGLDFPDGQHVWTLTCLGLSVLPPKVQWNPYYTGQPTCKDNLQCPDPTPINGTLKVLSGKPYGYACKVQLTCDPGLDFPDGQHIWILTCEGLPVHPPQVMWDKEYAGQPTCKDDLQCPDPTPVNGTLKVLYGHPYGLGCNVLLTCYPGMEFPDGKHVWNMTCEPIPVSPLQVIWTITFDGHPTCKGYDCSNPKPIHGTYKVLYGQPFTDGCIVLLTCNPGLVFPDGKRVWNITCTPVPTIPPQSFWIPLIDGHPLCKARRTSDTTITRPNEADNDASDFIDPAETKLIDTSDYLPEEDLDGTQFIIQGEPNEITVNIDTANTVGQNFERMENIEERTNQIAEHIEDSSTDINGNAHEQPTSDNDIEEQQQQGEIENIDANESDREEVLEEREPEEVNEIEEVVEMPTEELERSNDHQAETEDEETIEEELEGDNNEHNVEEITDEMSGEASVIETEDNENQHEVENYIEPLEDIDNSHDIENTNTIEHVTEESEEEVEPPNEVEETIVEHEDEMEVEENDEEEESMLAEEALRQYIHDLDEDTVGEEGEDDPQISENESNERIIVINNDEHLPVVNYLKNENEIIVNTEEPADILTNEIFEETDDIPELEEMYTQYLEQQRIKHPRRIQADIKDVEFSWHDKVEKADEMDEGFYDSDEDINTPGALHDIQAQPVESHGNDIEIPDEPDLCKFPAKTGFCKARMRRYFFNDETKQCEVFYYGGCGGNANNFQTLKDCLNACKPTVSL